MEAVTRTMDKMTHKTPAGRDKVLGENHGSYIDLSNNYDLAINPRDTSISKFFGLTYPSAQNFSKLISVFSSTNGGVSRNVTFSSCNSASLPVRFESSMKVSTARVIVDIGVMIIPRDLKTEGSPAMFVSIVFND
jgi:hypothetical protein